MPAKLIKQFFASLLFTAIPTVLSYLASSQIVFSFLINIKMIPSTTNVPLVQDYCLWIGLALSGIFITFRNFFLRMSADRLTNERNQLIGYCKYNLTNALMVHIPSLPEYDIRIFIPKHPLLYKLSSHKLFKRIPIEFAIKNVEIIAHQDNTRKLSFEVSPRCEGLVGRCYRSKNIEFDDNLEQTNSTDYNLGNHQLSRTSRLEWAICCPIFNDKNEVVAILSLDSTSKITIGSHNLKLIKNQITDFAQILYDSAPQLFK